MSGASAVCPAGTHIAWHLNSFKLLFPCWVGKLLKGRGHVCLDSHYNPQNLAQYRDTVGAYQQFLNEHGMN